MRRPPFPSARATSYMCTTAACLILLNTIGFPQMRNPPPGGRWNEFGWPWTYLTTGFTRHQTYQYIHAPSEYDIASISPAELTSASRVSFYDSFESEGLLVNAVVLVTLVVMTGLFVQIIRPLMGGARAFTIKDIFVQTAAVAIFAAFTRSALLQHTRYWYYAFRPLWIILFLIGVILVAVWIAIRLQRHCSHDRNAANNG